jgi:hypothetical protein
MNLSNESQLAPNSPSTPCVLFVFRDGRGLIVPNPIPRDGLRPAHKGRSRTGTSSHPFLEKVSRHVHHKQSIINSTYHERSASSGPLGTAASRIRHVPQVGCGTLGEQG